MTRICIKIIFDDLTIVQNAFNSDPSPWILRATPYAHKAAERRLS